MEVDGEREPARVAVRGAHAVEQRARRLLRLHAVEAHVARELGRQRELRLEHRELVRERDCERG